MNQSLNDRERRVARINLAWGFVGGVVITLVVGLIWEVFA